MAMLKGLTAWHIVHGFDSSETEKQSQDTHFACYKVCDVCVCFLFFK